jgi:predicted lipid-binding transport protein (Tim44 family)
MKYLVAAAAALSLIGGATAMAQPAYDNHSRGQTYYGQSGQGGHGQQYSATGHRGSAQGYSYGYAQPYAGYGYRGGASYYGAQAYSYNDRHDRRAHRQAQRGHYDGTRYNGHDRH